jgi:hypothetical protein
MINSNARPWVVDSDGLPRYMHGGTAHIILKGYVHETYEFYDILAIQNGTHIEIQRGTAQDTPSIYRQGDTWMRFESCKRNRMWVGCPCALTPDEDGVVVAFIEFTSDSWNLLRITQDDFN